MAGPRKAPQRRTRADSEDVRERLLDAASKLFSQRGIHAVGVDEVCGRAGVAKMSLYKHFRGKDQLVSAYLQRTNTGFLAAVQASIAPLSADPRAQILAVFDFLAQWFASDDFRGCPFLNAVAELADEQHPARAVCREHKQSLQSMLASLIQRSGRPDSAALSDQLMVLIDGSVLRAQLLGSAEPAMHARATAERLLA